MRRSVEQGFPVRVGVLGSSADGGHGTPEAVLLPIEIGCGGSSAFRRFRPSRRRTLVTVEIGMPSWRAIAGELIRCRRSRSISATLSGGSR